ncbi:glutamate receptor, partial [Tropilaelaps mercedesae]
MYAITVKQQDRISNNNANNYNYSFSNTYTEENSLLSVTGYEIQGMIPKGASNIQNLHYFKCRRLGKSAAFLDYQPKVRPRDRILSSLVVSNVPNCRSLKSCLEQRVDGNVFLLKICNKETIIKTMNDTVWANEATEVPTVTTTLVKKNRICAEEISREDRFDEANHDPEDNFAYKLEINSRTKKTLLRKNHQKSTSNHSNHEPHGTRPVRRLVRRLTTLNTDPGSWISSALLPLMVVFAAAACLPSAVDSAKSPTDTFAIGGVFDQGEESHFDAHLSQAVERINRDGALLRGRELQSVAFKTNPGDSFVASKCVCELARRGVAALVGPTSWQVASYVASAAARLHLPHLQTSTGGFRERRSPFSLQLHPAVSQLNRAYHDLIKSHKWKSFAVLYDNDNVFVALKDVLNASLNPPNVLMYPYNPALSFKKMLKDIGSKNIYNIILHLDLTKVPQLFREAEEVNQTTLYHDYIVMGL